MGIRDMIKGKESGHRCEIDGQGVTHCQVYEKDKDGKMSTGTDFSFTVNKETGCEPIMQGSHDINDSDVSRVDSIIAQRTKACRKGI